MAVITKPCLPTGSIKPGQKKEFNLTPAQIRPLYEYMRKRYLDQNWGHEAAIEQMNKEFNLPDDVGNRFWSEIITGSKRDSIKTKAQLKVEAERKQARFEAEQFIRRADMGNIHKSFDFLEALPRALYTGYHAGAVPGTHGGALLWRPSAWAIWARGFKDTWKAMSPTEYEAIRKDIFDNSAYPRQIAGGLRIRLDERQQGLLSGWLNTTPGWNQHGWIGVMKMRQDVDVQNYNRFKIPPGQELAFEKALAPIANHATGVVEDPHVWGVFGKYEFSPQLTASKVYRTFVDPYETAKTVLASPANAKEALTGMFKMAMNAATLGRYKVRVSSPEMAAALTRMRNASEYFLTRYSMLALNSALLQANESPYQVNWHDFSKGDIWRFKTGTGLTIADRGLEDMMKSLGQMIYISTLTERERHGKGLWDAEIGILAHQAEYKMEPGIETYGELLLGEDIFQRPLPKFLQLGHYLGMPVRTGTLSRTPYTLDEYALSHTPLAVNGPIADMYERFNKEGMPPTDATGLFNLSLGLFLHGVLGAGTRYVPPEEATGPPPRLPTRQKKYGGAL